MSGGNLDARLEFLRRTQNPDGGWGYFPGKRSWLEPTIYSTLALHSTGYDGEVLQKAHRCLDSWTLPEGGWRAGAEVSEYHWASALCLVLDSITARKSRGFDGGLRRILLSNGAESSAYYRVVGSKASEMNRAFLGWSYRPGSTAWVEPTALSLLALKKVARRFGNGLALVQRVSSGEQMLLERRCADGGWNYGNRRVLGVTLPSYPEGTAMALLGLQGVQADLSQAIVLAEHSVRETTSPLAYFWSRLALRSHRQEVPPERQVAGRTSQDVLLAALECLAQAPRFIFAVES